MSAERYSKVAVILHWLIGIALLCMIAFGIFMTDLPKEAAKQTSYDLFNLGVYTVELAKEESPRAFYYNLHKSCGITLFALILFRLFWRFTHRPPAMLRSYSFMERKMATAAHHVLYLLMVLIPLSGFLMSINSKYGVKWFGIKLAEGLNNKECREFFYEIHEYAAFILLAIVVLHIIGALKHKFVDKDETMQRMSLK